MEERHHWRRLARHTAGRLIWLLHHRAAVVADLVSLVDLPDPLLAHAVVWAGRPELRIAAGALRPASIGTPVSPCEACPANLACRLWHDGHARSSALD